MQRLFWYFLVAIGTVVWQADAIAAERTVEVPVAVSSGQIFLVDPVGHYVMIQKPDGKKVSLELTAETEVRLDGQPLPLDELSRLKVGDPATARHFTNDSGMQRTLELEVHGEEDRR